MKSYKQFVGESPTVGVGEPISQTGGTDSYDIQNAEVLKRVNAFVGSIADREYLIPENALKTLNTPEVRFKVSIFFCKNLNPHI